MRNVPNFKIINLDMFGKEFRKGYDAASLTQAVRECIVSLRKNGTSCPIFLKIHGDSLPVCQGLCAENMILAEVLHEIPIDAGVLLEPGETWLKLMPNMAFWM